MQIVSSGQLLTNKLTNKSNTLQHAKYYPARSWLNADTLSQFSIIDACKLTNAISISFSYLQLGKLFVDRQTWQF